MSAGLLAGLIVLMIAPVYYGPQLAQLVDATLGQAQREHLGLPVAIIFFIAASFVGAPQLLLVGAAVFAFGPDRGFAYALISTVAAGAVNYFAGHVSRTEARKHFSGPKCRRLMRFMGRNAFLASFLIRNVPTAPFVVVNVAFGVARADFWGFVAGMALGSIPKTAIVAFGLNVVMDALDGDVGVGAFACVVCIGVCLLGMAVVRRWVRRGEASDAAAPGDGNVTEARAS